MRLNVDAGATWFLLEPFSWELHHFSLFVLIFLFFSFLILVLQNDACVGKRISYCLFREVRLFFRRIVIGQDRQPQTPFVLCELRTRVWDGRAKNFYSIPGKRSKRFFSSPKDPGWLQIQPNWQWNFYSRRWQRIFMSMEQCLDSFTYLHDMVFI